MSGSPFLEGVGSVRSNWTAPRRQAGGWAMSGRERIRSEMVPGGEWKGRERDGEKIKMMKCQMGLISSA